MNYKTMHMSNRILWKITPQNLLQSIESSKSISHKAIISAEFDSMKTYIQEKLEQRPQILVNLSFRELRD